MVEASQIKAMSACVCANTIALQTAYIGLQKHAWEHLEYMHTFNLAKRNSDTTSASAIPQVATWLDRPLCKCDS